MTAVNTWEVQKALHALLDADAPLAALVGDRIKDRRDQSTVFPHITLGPDVSVSDRTNDGDGVEVTATLDYWSRYKGFKEIKEIRHAVRVAVDCQNLTVTGLTSCIAFVDGGPDILDRDGITRHGVERVRLICRE